MRILIIILCQFYDRKNPQILKMNFKNYYINWIQNKNHPINTILKWFNSKLSHILPENKTELISFYETGIILIPTPDKEIIKRKQVIYQYLSLE